MYAMHSVNHVKALNKRKHSIVLKYAKEARSNGVLHVQIFALTALYTYYRRMTCPDVLYKRTMFVNELDL